MGVVQVATMPGGQGNCIPHPVNKCPAPHVNHNPSSGENKTIPLFSSALFFSSNGKRFFLTGGALLH